MFDTTTLDSVDQDSARDLLAQLLDAGADREVVTKLIGYLDSVERAASTDSVTGLANRAQFGRDLTATWAHAMRAGEAFAVLYLDLDRFKEVNDTHGHAAGDRVLTCVGEKIRAAVRGYDIPARIGGDEFAIILPAATAADVDHIKGRICEAITGCLGTDVGVSIGEAYSLDGYLTPAEMMERADVAMYAVKRAGR